MYDQTADADTVSEQPANAYYPATKRETNSNERYPAGMSAGGRGFKIKVANKLLNNNE